MSINIEIIQHEHGGLYDHHRKLQHLQRKMDLVFADPPYNIGIKYADDPTGDRLAIDEYWAMIRSAMDCGRNLLRPGGMIWWVCPLDHIEIMRGIGRAARLQLVYQIVWHETFAQYNRHDLTKDYRFLLAWQLPGCKHTFNADSIREPSARMMAGDKRAKGPRLPGMVWRLRRLQGSSPKRVPWHPAQVGPEVLQRIIKGWTNADDHVADLFAGSGSLGVECKELGRNFYGLDASPTYCKLMRERLGVATMQEVA